MKTTIKFFYNGLKVDGNKKLYKAHYSFSKTRFDGKGTVEDEHITVYGSGYGNNFTTEIYNTFNVKNETDYNTDYFDKDHFRVSKSHPLFKAAAQAYIKQQTKTLKRFETYEKKHGLHPENERFIKDLEEFKATYIS